MNSYEFLGIFIPCGGVCAADNFSKKRGDFGSLMGRASNFNGFTKTSEVYAPKH